MHAGGPTIATKTSRPPLADSRHISLPLKDMFTLLSFPNYRVGETEGSRRQKGGGRGDRFRCSATAGCQIRDKGEGVGGQRYGEDG